MERRKFIAQSMAAGLSFHPLAKLAVASAINSSIPEKLKGPRKPVFIYNDWSSYDELSDNIPLTETLAMKELGEIRRLKSSGVQIDYYLMDAFWFDRDGGYRTWHKQHWPNGPDRWLKACKENSLLPGMWFSTNLIFGGGNIILNMIPEWKNSEATDPGILCLFEGDYLAHLAGSLQLWYDKGVRLFKFDFAYFEAVTPSASTKFSPAEIQEKNKIAFMQMLQDFRKKNKDILITGYNGFGGVLDNTYTPFTKTIDLRWLDSFDTLYSGDPRFSDVPMMNIWRSEDVYHDHQNRQFEYNGLPLRRIDSCAFMNGVTGTCYSRAMNCWKGMLILDLARGGWMNVYHGNMELFNDEDAKWFAKVQAMFHHFQTLDTISSFGGLPGLAQPHGFKAEDARGKIITVVNPSQQVAVVQMPVEKNIKSRILYADGGFIPQASGNTILLGAEQLAVIGFGDWANEKYDLGIDDTIQIPHVITQLEVEFRSGGRNVVEAAMKQLPDAGLRIIFQQFDAHGNPVRTSGGAPPNGIKMSHLLSITGEQMGQAVPMIYETDKMIWSGLSWAASEIKKSTIDFSKPLTIKCSSGEKQDLTLKAAVYAVNY